jgi:hypothetical protein
MSTFSMDFDFTIEQQKNILGYLQSNNYRLLGYKAADGPTQIDVGVPTWFSMSFGNMFGKVAIDYTPKYKVYVYNEANIAAGTTIDMHVLSGEYELGTSLVFKSNGTITTGAGTAPSDSIMLKDERGKTTPNVTVGLAGLVNLPSGKQYLPFCAFTLTPQGSISMTPKEKILLFAAQTDLQSGNVQAMASAPGCSFSFSSATTKYQLQIIDGTYGITNKPETASVAAVSSGETLKNLLGS